MFVTILSSIYLALAVFVVVRLVNTKRQKIADWAARKGFIDSYLHKIISAKSSRNKRKADISKIYID